MNPFADLLKDKVFIVSRDGQRQGPFKTNLQKGRATIFARALEVTPGDTLVRPRPDSSEESYTIEDFQFAEGMMDIPESYTFVLSEDFTLVNQKVVDESGSPDGNGDVQKLQHLQTALKELSQAIDTSTSTTEEKIIAKSKITELLSNPTISSLMGNTSEDNT